jgi:hypothetical protein
MKSILYLFFVGFVLSSCVKYTQPKLLSLSGEYRFDKITVEETDNTGNPIYTIYDDPDPDSSYINPSAVDVLDTIQLYYTSIHLDYSMIRFKPISNVDGSKTWTKEYYYYVNGPYSIYDLGYLKFNCENNQLVHWKILDDGLESLVVRTTGQWPFGNAGPHVSITYHMTRVGP